MLFYSQRKCAIRTYNAFFLRDSTYYMEMAWFIMNKENHLVIEPTTT